MKRYKSIVDALDHAPTDKTFVTFWVDEDERKATTFGQFRHLAECQAGALRASGVKAGDRVVLIMPQGTSLMVAFTACLILNAVPAILAYPNFKVEPSKYRYGLAGVTANLHAKFVIIDQDFPADLREHIDLGASAQLIVADASDTASPVLQARSTPGPAHVAFIQHSAGTTGLQKGVALTHSAVLRHLEHLSSVLKIDEADVIYSWLPLYHDMGLIACFMLPLVCHVPVVMQSPTDWVMRPDSMLRIFTDCRCTISWLPNFAFQFVPRRTPVEDWGTYDLSSARALINCSEPVRASSMNEFYRAFSASGLRKAALHSCYAMAENVFAVTQSDLSQPEPKVIWADGASFRLDGTVLPLPENAPGAIAFTSSGNLLPNNHVRIVGDDGQAQADGRVGEIAIQSDTLFEGYYNRKDLTAEALREGWYYSGDLGFMLDGHLYVVGRKKDLLIVGGENIYPQDVEEIVCKHDAVRDGRAVAFGLFNAELGTDDIAVVAEVESDALLQNAHTIEREIQRQVVSEMGVSLRHVFLKPPMWIVKSTAGKPARSATRDKLLREQANPGFAECM